MQDGRKLIESSRGHLIFNLKFVNISRKRMSHALVLDLAGVEQIAEVTKDVAQVGSAEYDLLLTQSCSINGSLGELCETLKLVSSGRVISEWRKNPLSSLVLPFFEINCKFLAIFAIKPSTESLLTSDDKSSILPKQSSQLKERQLTPMRKAAAAPTRRVLPS